MVVGRARMTDNGRPVFDPSLSNAWNVTQSRARCPARNLQARVGYSSVPVEILRSSWSCRQARGASRWWWCQVWSGLASPTLQGSTNPPRRLGIRPLHGGELRVPKQVRGCGGSQATFLLPFQRHPQQLIKTSPPRISAVSSALRDADSIQWPPLRSTLHATPASRTAVLSASNAGDASYRSSPGCGG